MMLSEGGYGKWEQIKKGISMQAGAAAGMKSMGATRGNAKIKKKLVNRKIEYKNNKLKLEQMSFLDVIG
jgi:hypothetical protein